MLKTWKNNKSETYDNTFSGEANKKRVLCDLMRDLMQECSQTPGVGVCLALKREICSLKHSASDHEV